jgi:hypothetical protein
MKTVINFILILSSTLLLSQSCYAKLIEPKELQKRIVKGYAGINQLKLDLATTVFDFKMFHKSGDDKQDLAPPHELKELSFTQKMFWAGGQSFGIETFDSSGEIANIFFRDGDKQINRQLQDNVLFNIEDILFFHAIFYTKSILELQHSLHNLGIPTNDLSLVPRNKMVLYRLGSAEENIVIEPTGYRIVEINRLIKIDGSYYPYKIIFSKWDRIRKRVPRVIRVYINSRLIKTTRVTDLKFGSVTKSKSKFLSEYRSYLSDQ